MDTKTWTSSIRTRYTKQAQTLATGRVYYSVLFYFNGTASRQVKSLAARRSRTPPGPASGKFARRNRKLQSLQHRKRLARIHYAPGAGVMISAGQQGVVHAEWIEFVVL
jgi:hypothetical protein